jgi:ribosomal protein L25 (general stress protein Ctc)
MSLCVIQRTQNATEASMAVRHKGVTNGEMTACVYCSSYSETSVALKVRTWHYLFVNN